MKTFKTFIAESPVQVVSRWLHKHNPNRLKNDATEATKLALARKSPASVKRALKLKAAAVKGIDPASQDKAEYYSSIARKIRE
jgi:hypothetical protein